MCLLHHASQIQEVLRFGKTTMTEAKFILLAVGDTLPGKYTPEDVTLLRRGVQFHEHEIAAAGYQVHGPLHAFGR